MQRGLPDCSSLPYRIQVTPLDTDVVLNEHFEDEQACDYAIKVRFEKVKALEVHSRLGLDEILC